MQTEAEQEKEMKPDGEQRKPEEIPEGAPKGELEADAHQKEIQSLRNQLLRLQADFENAKKRWLKKEAELQEIANKEVLSQLLDIYDDFERALSAASENRDVNVFIAGVEMISKRLESFLKSYGVTKIEAAGKLFDPEQHEAVAHEATESVPETTVLAEMRTGYLINGRVLRPAVVKVAVKPEGASPESKDCLE